MASTTHSEPAPSLDEVWRLFRETDRRFQETDRKLSKLERLFTSQWGKLVESLVEGKLIELFNQRGFPVRHTYTRAKGVYQDRNWEFDIVAKNGEAVIIVEVKTTLRPDDVKEFLDELPQAKLWMQEYAGNRVYGAMAYLSAEAGAETMAANKGLFVIKATGDSARVQNPPDFAPRVF
jgi:hypothetical protein